MAELTDRIIKKLDCPASGNRIHYDDHISGFGVRVTAAGSKAFIFNYRIHGRERRMTLGSYPAWTLVRARKRAGELRRMVDSGADPLGEKEEQRKAPTMADLCARFEDEHFPKLRSKTTTEYKAIIETYILPAMKHLKVADVAYADIDALHRKITQRGATYRANRCVAILSKMLNLAVRWKMRPDNPAKGVEKNAESRRYRYLNPTELAALAKALAEHDDRQAVNIIRLAMLTGARRGEVQSMRWDQLALSNGIWTKPGSTTKQKTEHRVPLSAPARQLLVELHEAAERTAKKEGKAVSQWVFPSHGETGHRVEIKQQWYDVCKAAGITRTVTVTDKQGRERIVVKHGARIHDLRHTYASVLASSKQTLPIIGALLGHSQPQTTARYSHLFDDPLRAATEGAGAIVTGKPSAEIVDIRGRA